MNATVQLRFMLSLQRVRRVKLWTAELLQKGKNRIYSENTMAAIQKADISEQKEIVLTSETEQKIAPNQSLEITAASGQEKQTPKIQFLKRESRPNEPKKSREELKIETLTDITKSQQEQITNLEKELEETMEALFKERQEKQQLCAQLRQQNKDITKKQLQARFFESEMKTTKRDKEDVTAQLAKAEFDKEDLNAMLCSVAEQRCKINQTLKEEKDRNAEQTRKLEEVQSKTGEIQNEVTELDSQVATLQNEVAYVKSEKAKLQDMNFAQENEIIQQETVFKETEGRMFSIASKHSQEKAALESEINEYKHSVNDYKLSLEEATALLKKTKRYSKTIFERLKTFKVKSDRRGKILKADKETKAEMKETIDALKNDNERLQAELDSGFVGRYRGMKRFLGRVINPLLSPF